jgi:hypothetical protein
MSKVVLRALDLIGDHLRTHKAGGGADAPLDLAKQVIQQRMDNPAPAAPPAAEAAPKRPTTEGSVFAGAKANPLQSSYEAENRPSVIVSPRPGKGGGPPITPEKGLDYSRELHDDRDSWSPASPNLLGAGLPPPVQHPVFNEPRMGKLTEHVGKIFKDKKFNDLIEEHTGLRNLTVKPTIGTWQGEMEPSFILHHPDMNHEQAHKIANLLGFGFQQDATVHVKHNADATDGVPALLIGNGNKLTQKHVDAIHEAAKPHGLDFTVTGDGKAAKFLHFGGDEKYDDFLDRVSDVADKAKMDHKYHARSSGDLINAEDYLPNIFGTKSGPEGVQGSTERSPDLFGRIVDHVLAPYAKATAGEGYRLSPQRLAQTFGLTENENAKVRDALYPSGKKNEDRTTVPLMTGEEKLDVRPTGNRGNATVGDVLYALQNRAASKGQIDPGDFSDKAKNTIAKDMAEEVAFHVKNSDKSAIGWYDSALNKAMDQYAQIFPELKTDKDKEMLFHAILGITSQGNDVYSNSVHAARLYNMVRDGKASLPEAIDKLKGSFGDKTRAIETNLEKFHHLVNENGYDAMRDQFNQKKTVSEWNKVLRENNMFRMPNGEPLQMQGGKDQTVSGWMVFGPKIGSFINNLHGDYSTLTADLWFSRTWNRLLGHNFIHTPLAEQKQYQDFKDAFKAEFLHNNGFGFEQSIPYKTSEGQFKGEEGSRQQWLHGADTKELNWDDYHKMVDDPDAMLDYATTLHDRYKDSQYKGKSDLRRRAKNWVENRELPVAAPRSGNERAFQQDTAEAAQKYLKKKYGMDISVADIQAALWFHEKELFSQLGVASEKAKPADYEDAAKHAMGLVNSGNLYTVKSKKTKKPKAEEEDEGFARGGTAKAHPASIIPGVHIVGHNPIFHGDE